MNFSEESLGYFEKYFILIPQTQIIIWVKLLAIILHH